MTPSQLARRSHPRRSGWPVQLLVLLVAAALGVGLGALLHWGDARSWSGARTTTAVVLGLQPDGIRARAEDGRDLVLHLEKVPAAGTELSVQVRPDGRARPTSYQRSWSGSVLEGVLLAAGLAVLVQLYRWFVTGRPVPSEP